MIVNKKLDRLKQWSKERMGAEIKTDTSADFKSMELEIQLRHGGCEDMKKSADCYVKALSKRERCGEDHLLPGSYLGSTMFRHGEDFESGSEFALCLTAFGAANERIARMQETYAANVAEQWLKPLESSLALFKEYHASRKRLEGRRLAYDTASAKLQKTKREDSKMEEELQAQRFKYEESNEDVIRRMLEIQESDAETIAGLTAFLDAKLSFHDRCREVLVQVKKEWPRKPVTSSDIAPESTSGGDDEIPCISANDPQPRPRAASVSGRRNRVGDPSSHDPKRPPPPVPPSRGTSRARSATTSNSHPAARSISSDRGGFLHQNVDRNDKLHALTRVPTVPAQWSERIDSHNTSISQPPSRPASRGVSTNTYAKFPRSMDGPEGPDLPSRTVAQPAAAAFASASQRAGTLTSSDQTRRAPSPHQPPHDLEALSTKKAPPLPPPALQSDVRSNTSLLNKGRPPPPPLKRSIQSSGSVLPS